MQTVVIAYEGFGDIQIETDTVSQTGAEIVYTRRLDTPEAQEAAIKADALMVTIQSVPADLISRMECCRIISRVGTGLDAIDIPAATKRGIWVTNVPDYSIDEVSTHAVTMMLVHERRIPNLLQMVREKGWYDASLDRPARRLALLTFGVLGFGRIGRATVSKAHGLGMRVIVYDPFVTDEAVAALGATRVDLETLLRESDYLSLHSPLTDETRQIINVKTLAMMKPTAFLINAARGGMIDETALLAAVQSGQLAGAALDVLTVEPPAPDHPFRKEPRIWLTPHNAWYSEEARAEVRLKASEEVVRVLRGERPRCPVNQI